MLSEKMRLLLHLTISLLAFIFLYIMAFAGIFIDAGMAPWWMPIAQLFFILIGCLWGKIKVPADTHGMEVYIAIVSCVCFLPVLFMKSIGFISFPLFVGWAMTFVSQLMSLLNKTFSEK